MKECSSPHLFSHDNPLGPQLPRMQRGLPTKRAIPQVAKVLLVSSGKGGVGKSTTAVNLAIALAQAKQRVGILDADIFGPSLPKLMNLYEEPNVAEEGGRITPLTNYGIQCMSMGFLVGEQAPIAWRGLMVMKAVQQLLYEVAWDPLDILVVDMPPGTGDVQLSIGQLVPVNGAIIITTPQELSLLDATRGVNMFRKVQIPILGLVQNMSYYVCPHCQTESQVFGPDSAARAAQDMDIPLLGRIPLEADISAGADCGVPITVAQPNSPHTQVYRDLAQRVIADLK
ncbi:P-loop containing nucleoside triphosphate hydrolase protein [Dimargaris cristalligena]|uniref:Nucleotide-binding protein-like n=1 Tax=Dimargaris cristalligena TaxID=215637 RepID=A0A4P9ZSJ0_9FUNG|nr:P-loop containing nucleoside triphosphate hydrolase protein [Dimargaris cristalligena]|eukprot:RKP35440.1 P-loop containing nucleoside triphosphate hydrolase protein [Dimargaris cristalligena]